MENETSKALLSLLKIANELNEYQQNKLDKIDNLLENSIQDDEDSCFEHLGDVDRFLIRLRRIIKE